MKSTIIPILLLMLGLPFVALAQDVPVDEEDVYYILSTEAERAIAEGDYPTAVERLKEAMNARPSNPSNVLLLCNLATVYGYMGEDSLSIATYTEAHRMAPSMTYVLERRGQMRLRSGDNAGAFQDFTDVIERDSCNLTARYYHGMMSLYGGDRFAAEADFDILASEAPDALDTAIALATLYGMTGHDSDAIPYYIKVIEHEPYAEYYAALAGCYLSTNQYSEATATIKDGLELWPDDPELYYYRAWLNRDTYRLAQAHADAQRAVSLGLDPRKADALFAK